MSGRAKKAKRKAARGVVKPVGGGMSIARRRASAEVKAAMLREDLARAEAVLSRWTFGIDPAQSVRNRPHIDAFREGLGLLMADPEMDAGMAVKVERVLDLLFKAVVRDVGKTGLGVGDPPRLTLDTFVKLGLGDEACLYRISNITVNVDRNTITSADVHLNPYLVDVELRVPPDPRTIGRVIGEVEKTPTSTLYIRGLSKSGLWHVQAKQGRTKCGRQIKVERSTQINPGAEKVCWPCLAACNKKTHTGELAQSASSLDSVTTPVDQPTAVAGTTGGSTPPSGRYTLTTDHDDQCPNYMSFLKRSLVGARGGTGADWYQADRFECILAMLCNPQIVSKAGPFWIEVKGPPCSGKTVIRKIMQLVNSTQVSGHGAVEREIIRFRDPGDAKPVKASMELKTDSPVAHKQIDGVLLEKIQAEIPAIKARVQRRFDEHDVFQMIRFSTT